MVSDYSDEELAKLVQQGEHRHFSTLIERYETKMLRYARRFLFNTTDAEDLVQDVFLKAYMNIQGFDTSRRFSPWMYRIAHNAFVNALKRKGKDPLPFFDPDTLFPHPVSSEQTDRSVNDEDLKKTMDACLADLDPKYREPLVLFYFEELAYQEIAEVLQIPMSTVGVRIKRAKEALKRLYIEHNPEYQAKPI